MSYLWRCLHVVIFLSSLWSPRGFADLLVSQFGVSIWEQNVGTSLEKRRGEGLPISRDWMLLFRPTCFQVASSVWVVECVFLVFTTIPTPVLAPYNTWSLQPQLLTLWRHKIFKRGKSGLVISMRHIPSMITHYSNSIFVSGT